MKLRVLGDSQAGRDMLFRPERKCKCDHFSRSHAPRGNAVKARCAASRAVNKLKCRVSLSRTQRVPSCIPTQRVGTRQNSPQVGRGMLRRPKRFSLAKYAHYT